MADTINTKELGGTGAALEGLWAHLVQPADACVLPERTEGACSK